MSNITNYSPNVPFKLKLYLNTHSQDLRELNKMKSNQIERQIMRFNVDRCPRMLICSV